MKRERKQKPAESKTTNYMRKALLAKIRDYQKRGEFDLMDIQNTKPNRGIANQLQYG